MRPTTAQVLRVILIFYQSYIASVSVEILYLAATLQKKTNALGSEVPPEIVAAYDTTFNYALLVRHLPSSTTPSFDGSPGF